MDVPGIVEEALDGEEVAADVDLGGDDALFVTPTRTLIYRSEGLLSDESVESYSHDAESMSLSEGRRKTRITLEHPIEGVSEFTLPSSAADAAIPSILAGVLRSNDVIAESESVVDSYLFSELTLVVTDDRLVKHVGEMLWDLEFEEYPYADVTAVYAEQGSVATQLVVEVDGRAERIKTPSDRSREVRETLEDALRRFHGIRPDEELNDALAPAEPDTGGSEAEPASEEPAEVDSGMDFGDGVEPLSAGDTTQDGRNPDPSALDRDPDSSVSDPSPSSGQGSSASGQASSASEPAPSTTESDDAEQEQPRSADAMADRSESDQSPVAEANGQERSDATAPTSGAAGASESTGSERRGSTDDAATASSSASSRSASQPSASGAEQSADEFQDAGFEPAADPTEELAEEVAELRTAVQKQNKLLTRQHKTIEKLVEELRRGR